MLLTTLLDYLIDPKTGEILPKKFHIKDHPFYEQLAFPYYFNEESVLLDSNGETAYFVFETLDSLDWDFVEEDYEKPDTLN